MEPTSNSACLSKSYIATSKYSLTLKAMDGMFEYNENCIWYTRVLS